MTTRTKRPQLRIDAKATLSGGAVIETGGTPAGPGVTILSAPQLFRVTSSALAQSSTTPRAVVNLAWARPASPGPVDSYLVQWALNSGFSGAEGVPVPGTQVTAGVLTPAGTLIYLRIAAIAAGGVQGAWSTAITTTTPVDTTPPAAPTGLLTTWSGLTGDLDVRWTNPTSPNFRDVRVRIYASNGGALLRETNAVAGRFVWTKGMQYADTSGTYDPSVYIVLTARSVGGVLSASDLTGTATLAAPGAPAGLTSSWASDPGTAGANCRITWTASAAVASYRLSIDGSAVGREAIAGGGYDYSFDLNRAEHGGTPDAALSLSLVAVDALGQTSAAATLTATNAAPPATTISAFGAFTMVGLTIGASGAQDLQDYRVRVYKAAVLVRTIFVTATNITYVIEDGNGNYTFDVAARDRFGQIGAASAQTAPVELVDQGDFIADLRAGLSYQDSVGTAPETLNGLKDDNTGTNVVTYASSASTWRWTEGIRALEVRHRKSTLSISASASFYYGVSLDGITYTWYAGGTATGGVWSPVVQASETAARTAATVLSAGVWRISLAATIEGWYFRLGHRNTTTSYALREFYPRSLVEADDINVESLSAISANLGTITAGTITGLTIQTATSGARVVIDSSGLKTYNSAGQLVLQATTTTDGALRAYTTAGVNYYTLGSTGGQIVSTDTGGLDTLRAYRIVNSSGNYAGGYGGYSDEFGSALTVDVTGRTSTNTTDGSAAVAVSATSSASSEIAFTATLTGAPTTETSLVIRNVGTGSSLTGIFANGSISTNDGLNVGLGVTGAATGQVKAQGSAASLFSATVQDATTNASTRILNLTHNSTGTPADGFGGSIRFGLESSTTADQLAAEIVSQWATAAHASRKGALVFQAVDSAGAREGLRIEATGSAPAVGFLGASAISRPTVTGSRGGNAALASVLTALANLGLITNSSSA